MHTALCLAALALSAAPATDAQPAATALYQERVVALEQTLADPNDLWVHPDDLTRINDFVLKPQGACLDELCIPVRQEEDSDLFVTRNEQGWFSVTGLANKLGQEFAYDADEQVWSFAEIPLVRSSSLEAGLAPDFALQDKDGYTRRLSDYLGKKVAIITWASW